MKTQDLVQGVGVLENPNAGLHLSRILVPLDFSRTSMEALDFAAALADQFKARIHLVHVRAIDEECAVPEAAHVMRTCAESVTSVHEKLSGVRASEHKPFWPENCHVRSGRAYQEICGLAREIEADLIVMASRGSTGFKRVVLGSTAERVARFSPCPVLVVRERKQKANGSAPSKDGQGCRVRKILVPVDFSKCGMAGVRYAAFLARALLARLCLFHAFLPPSPMVLDRVSSSIEHQYETDLANAKKNLQAFGQHTFMRGVKHEKEVCSGHVVDEICSRTKQPGIDLVVLSTRGRSGIDRFLLGSVAEHVLRYADCPVMVVPVSLLRINEERWRIR
jgi:nucleotide-binding universal stress UspA family protein